MQKRRLEQIDQLRDAADQTMQIAERYASRGNARLAGIYRDIATGLNRARYELIQYEDKQNRTLEALVRARNTIDAEFKEVA